MPAFSALTLLDGATTPVSHTFNPLTLIGNEAKYVDRVTGITLGYPVVTFQTSQPGKQSTMSKVRFKIAMPVMEVVNAATYNGITPAPTKAYDMTFDGTFFLPQRSTLQDRKHIRAFVKNILADALVTALVETQETVY